MNNVFRRLLSLLRPTQRIDDFAVLVTDKDWTQSQIDLISAQTEKVDFSLSSQTLTLTVRQVRGGDIQNLIFHILQRENREITRIDVSPCRAQDYMLSFHDGVLSEHRTVLDQNGKGPMRHTLEFWFSDVMLINRYGTFMVNQDDASPTRQTLLG